jgi:hypothetical protein
MPRAGQCAEHLSTQARAVIRGVHCAVGGAGLCTVEGSAHGRAVRRAIPCEQENCAAQVSVHWKAVRMAKRWARLYCAHWRAMRRNLMRNAGQYGGQSVHRAGECAGVAVEGSPESRAVRKAREPRQGSEQCRAMH